MFLVRRHLPSTARLLLGLVLFVFGLNGFLGLLPMPPLPSQASAFVGALAATGYMFPLIKGTEIVAGVLLLSNRFVPLALVILAPIVVNIVAFHVLLAPFSPLAFFVLAAELYLAWIYRDAFRATAAARVEPRLAPAAESADRRLPAHASS